MSVRGQIRELERRVLARGACSICGGMGTFDTIIIQEGVPPREPRPCPGCGKVRYVKKIILDSRPEPAGAFA